MDKAPTPSSTDPLVGRTLLHYEILRRVGMVQKQIDVEWKESQSPFIPVAKVTIKKQDVESDAQKIARPCTSRTPGTGGR